MKLVSISSCIRQVSQSNYEEDDGNYLMGFLDLIISKQKETLSDDNLNICDINFKKVSIFNNREMNILYNIAGFEPYNIIYSRARN